MIDGAYMAAAGYIERNRYLTYYRTTRACSAFLRVYAPARYAGMPRTAAALAAPGSGERGRS